MFKVGRIIDASLEEVPGGYAYKLGHSDETVAAAALEKLSLPLTAEAVKKLRLTTFDPLVTDKGGMKGKIEALQREVAAIRSKLLDQGRQLVEQGKIIASVQTELAALRADKQASTTQSRPQPEYPQRSNGSRHS